MKVLLFTHKNDIDGMGNAILAQLAFDEVNYVLCGTFDLTEAVESYYKDGSIYEYDRVYVTDLCLEDPVLSKVAADKNLEGKIQVFDHHKSKKKELKLVNFWYEPRFLDIRNEVFICQN